jgi:hypothetical protein
MSALANPATTSRLGGPPTNPEQKGEGESSRTAAMGSNRFAEHI